MGVHAPAWCELDRKRLLRHTVCYFLLRLLTYPAIASRYHPHPLLNHPIAEFSSGASRSPISYYSRRIPFHIRLPPVPASFFDIKPAIMRVLSALYRHPCQRNINISWLYHEPSSKFEFMVLNPSQKIGTVVFCDRCVRWQVRMYAISFQIYGRY